MLRLQVYGGGLIPIVAGLVLRSNDGKGAYIYIGALVMVYAAAVIIAILRTPETRGTNFEIDATGSHHSKRPLPVGALGI